MVSQMNSSKYVNSHAVNNALRASARLIVHKGIHHFEHPQSFGNDGLWSLGGTLGREKAVIHGVGSD